MVRHPEQEAILEETYDELEHDLIQRINGLQNQLQMAADKRNTIIQVNRAAKTAMEVFDDLLSKEHLDRKDLQLIIEKIKVYEDHLEIRLKADIDCLLRCGELPHEEDFVAAMARQGGNVNFPDGTGDISTITIVQSAKMRPDKVFRANVISNGEGRGMSTPAQWSLSACSSRSMASSMARLIKLLRLSPFFSAWALTASLRPFGMTRFTRS